MSIINHMIIEKQKKEKINKEIMRNVSILDEVTDLALNIANSREIIIDNLMFDYLILTEESKGLMVLCENKKVNYNELNVDVGAEVAELLGRDFDYLEVSKMSRNDTSNSLIRINKILILSKIKKKYPDVYYYILNRAKETADKIIKGII